MNVSPKEETVWLPLNDICLLFDRDKSVISRHIKTVIMENDLDEKRVVAKNATTANRSIILIDAYADMRALDFLKHKGNDVSLSIYHSSKAKLSSDDVRAFNVQYGNCSTFINDKYHDRFLIIDSKEVYHLGASLNYAGKKTFAITKMEDKYLIESIERNL